MTVIVVRGSELAADKQSNDSGVRRTITKIVRLPDGRLAGCAGDSAMSNRMMDWAANGSDPEKFPDRENKVDMLVLNLDGSVDLYCGGPAPDRLEDEFHAIGSGRDFALGAMHTGADVRCAVEAAIRFNTACGLGVDVMSIGADAQAT
jgi:hypothetical protein